MDDYGNSNLNYQAFIDSVMELEDIVEDYLFQCSYGSSIPDKDDALLVLQRLREELDKLESDILKGDYNA